MANSFSVKVPLAWCLFIAVCVSYAWGTSHGTCILRGRCQSYHYGRDEPNVADPGYFHRRRSLKVQVLRSCKYGFCQSSAKVYVTSGYNSYHKKLCHRLKSSKSFYLCPLHTRRVDLNVYWPRYRRKVVIKKINAGVSIKVVLPRSRYAKRYCAQLHSCKRVYPKKILITNAIQGTKCPSGRRRFPVGSKQDLNKRTLDGRLNNPKAIFNGAVGENLLRLSGNGYADGISALSGACTANQKAAKTCPYPKANNGTGSNRPNPRLISNTLLRQKEDIPSRRSLSDLSVYFGQFLDHDEDLTPELPRTFVQKKPNEVEIPIPVPKGDVIFDPNSFGNQTIPVRRFNFDTCTGNVKCRCPREHINVISAVIDANTVYGSDQKRLNALRTHKDGLMKLDKNGDLPFNTFGLPNGNAIGRDPKRLRIAGDTRANVAPTLLALHTLFVREHNRLAKLYKKRHPKASDETIFQYARKIVIAEMQAITYREYVTSIIGRRLPEYKGFNPKIDTGITAEFSTAAFRFGHTQISSLIFRFEENDKVSPYGHLLLREGFFHPERVTEEGGIDPVLRGAVKKPSQEIDSKMVDELRNFLFPKSGRGLDLGAVNIQRGRDLGIPDYNTVRAAVGLPRITSFQEITKNRKVASTLKALYRNVDNIDLFVGGISEDHVPGSELGPTFEKIFIEQMTRIRDGDRFWYERILSKKQIRYVNAHTLGRIIRLNTGYKDAPNNVFFASDLCSGVVNNQCVKRIHTKCNRYPFYN